MFDHILASLLGELFDGVHGNMRFLPRVQYVVIEQVCREYILLEQVDRPLVTRFALPQVSRGLHVFFCAVLPLNVGTVATRSMGSGGTAMYAFDLCRARAEPSL